MTNQEISQELPHQKEYEEILNRLNHQKPCRCRGMLHECSAAKQINRDIQRAHDIADQQNRLLAQQGANHNA